jgi:Secretion system C-terminal sorting domain
MNKLFTTLLLLSISYVSFGQHCAAVSNSAISVPDTAAGFKPSYWDLPCLVSGVAVSDTILFTNATTVPTFGFALDSLRIDSVSNLPAGICWTSNRPRNTVPGGQATALIMSGTPTTTVAGQYRLDVAVTLFSKGFILTGGKLALPSSQVRSLAGLAYFVRLKCGSLDLCPTVDTTGIVITAGEYNQVKGKKICLSTAIEEVGNTLAALSLEPNPMQSRVTVNFTSAVETSVDVRLCTLIGSTVMSRSVAVSHGANSLAIDRGNLPAGIYLLTLSQGQGSITRKLIIE